MLVPVILAGGVGSRLWPLSRENYPKQFLALIDEDRSLLQATLGRLRGIADAQPPCVVCNEEHRFLVAEQLRQVGVNDASIILEPVARNTAPAITLAALQALSHEEDAILLVMPADHVIKAENDFRKAVETGLSQAREGKLVTFGVNPDRPETGYGYIRKNKEACGSGAYPVAEFVEKPDLATAQEYLSSDLYYWNSGMFMFSAKTLLAELQAHAPDILEVCENAFGGIDKDMDFSRIPADLFSRCRSESIDYAVMEKTANAVVVPLESDWNDIGAWAAISDIGDSDQQGNTIKGDVLLHDAENNYVRAESRLVAGVGVKNLVVVETADAVLVAEKDSAQQVKAIVERLKAEDRNESTDHTRVYRPWGSYESIVSADRFQAKRIIVNPGAGLSLQLHHHRAEHWVVVKGCGRVTKGDEVFQLHEDESTYIPIGTKHRLENPGIIPLEIIEVQTGTYLGEDDIVRFEDRYGRGG